MTLRVDGWCGEKSDAGTFDTSSSPCTYFSLAFSIPYETKAYFRTLDETKETNSCGSMPVSYWTSAKCISTSSMEETCPMRS